MSDALNRGTSEGANCLSCPFAKDGRPNNPVMSEYPDDPMWIVLGDVPGYNETKRGRPFIGASGQVVDQILKKIGRPRDHLFVGNVTLCQPPQGSPIEERERAAQCCKPRLLLELAQFPSKPVLTLGAVAARTVIPKETLDAIDPPDVPKTRKRAAKEKQKAKHKEELRRQKRETRRRRAIEKIAKAIFNRMLKHERDRLKHEAIRVSHRKPDETYYVRELERVQKAMWAKAWVDGIASYEQKRVEAALQKAAKAQGLGKKPKKKKPIKITDIVGTLFDVDVDGSGVRPVIPAIHPAALLRGGGATIGGSHTPDMAFVNLTYDAAKVDALGKGKDIRLAINVEYELEDRERANHLFVRALQDALDEGACSIDLETYVDDPDRHHALMAYMAKIRVIGLATDSRSVSIAWDLLDDFSLSYFQLVLYAVKTAFHNALYDRTVLRNNYYGFNLPIVDIDPDAPEMIDTLLAHHAAFPGNSHTLQVVASQFFGVSPWKSQFRNQEETLDKLARYNALDTGATHALIPAISIHVKRTQTEVVYARDRRMSDIASRMHLRGMPVSREVNSQLVSTFGKLARDAKRKVEQQATSPRTLDAIRHHLALMLAGKPRKQDHDELAEKREALEKIGQPYSEYEALYQIRKRDLEDPDWYWKINNSKHIAGLLQALGVPLTQVTDGGAISTKKEVLESLVEHPIVRDILEYRENDKMLDFTWPIFDRERDGKVIQYGFADANDRIHPIWSIHKISGRWAGSEPHGVSNPPREKSKKVPFGFVLPRDAIILHFICECGKYDGDSHDGHTYKPKLIEYAIRPTTKRQIVSPKGRILVGFDFAQLEARILALISGDEFMCDVFNRNGDLHTECARDVFPRFDERTPAERKQARTVCKTLEYATWYGAADEKVWKGLLKEGYSFKLADVVGSLNILRRKMSGIVTWQRETIHHASQPPFELRDFVSGRRRVWPMGQVEASEALNIVPQATGAALMNEGMDRIDQRIHDRGYKECFPIVQVHDASVWECWEDDAEKLVADLKDCFESERTNPKNGKTVRFTIDPGVGQAWNEV